MIITKLKESDSYIIQVNAVEMGTINGLLLCLALLFDKKDNEAITFIKDFTDKAIKAASEK